MNWINAFSSQRFGVDNSLSNQRTEYERDWDRLVFSSAFRRLQNKTQVFPLPEEVFVHNRLTHSLEVASVGRSLGSIVGKKIAASAQLEGNIEAIEFYEHHLKSVIASACLAHDLGNPAFGHSGEEAISKFFIEKGATDSSFKARFSESEWADLISFEGNANALRILTRAFRGRMPGGFRLTYSTLGAILKYPCSARDSKGKKGPKHLSKYGYFQSDKLVFENIAGHLNLIPDGESSAFKRHPFVYLVEAADDICYKIIDFEDAHRLRIFSTEKVKEVLLSLLKLNVKEDFEKLEQTVLELEVDENEAVSFLRAKCINFLTNRCAEVFMENQKQILEGNFDSDLISGIPEVKEILARINQMSVEKIYNHPSVIKIELAGFRIMSGLVGDLVTAALLPKDQRQKSDEKVLALISSQYLFNESDSAYEKVMCIFDFVGGMTDLFALKLYRNLRGIEIPII